jgi:hypothetical protein
MRKLLAIIVLFLCFITPSQADDIRDFEIEGISVENSLLDYFTEKRIKQRTSVTKSNYKTKDYIRAYFILENSKNYNVLNIHYKNDPKYEIASISGAIMKNYTFEECFAKQKIIFDDLKKLFPKAEIEGNPKKKIMHRGDETKKSVYSSVKYVIDGGYIDVRCTIFSSEYKKKRPSVGSSLQVMAHTKDFIDWVRYETSLKK